MEIAHCNTAPTETQNAQCMATLNGSCLGNIKQIAAALRDDKIVLIQGVNPEMADQTIFSVAEHFDLQKSLELQAAFAASLGHRENIGKYFMSVNKRDNFQFIAPHSEGGRFSNMQLAAFYCFENSTDGGETILMNVNQDCRLWNQLREKIKRGKTKRELTPSEIQQIKVMARLNMPEDTLKSDDEILSQTEVDTNFTVYEVLAKPVKSFSNILNTEVYVYWDNIESTDYDSADEFHRFLTEHNLLKQPITMMDPDLMDDSLLRRIRNFGSQYHQLFKQCIIRKLLPGELIIQNNMTWCHSVNNWTPESGIRKVAAAFA